MSWLLVILIILGVMYFTCAIVYTLHTIRRVKRGGVKIVGVTGWLFVFFLWPICFLIEAAVDNMLM
jgi:hypothetical protein